MGQALLLLIVYIQYYMFYIQFIHLLNYRWIPMWRNFYKLKWSEKVNVHLKCKKNPKLNVNNLELLVDISLDYSFVFYSTLRYFTIKQLIASGDRNYHNPIVNILPLYLPFECKILGGDSSADKEREHQDKI